MAEPRVARENEVRASSKRQEKWAPPSILPEPDKQPGFSYRWVRVSTLDKSDPQNISSKLREGYEPVKIEEQPHFQMFIDPNSRFKGNIEVAGLLLCKIPVEFIEQRNEHYSRQTQAQAESVDNNFMKENDPRMPLFRERKSKVSFGKG